MASVCKIEVFAILRYPEGSHYLSYYDGVLRSTQDDSQHSAPHTESNTKLT